MAVMTITAADFDAAIEQGELWDVRVRPNYSGYHYTTSGAGLGLIAPNQGDLMRFVVHLSEVVSPDLALALIDLARFEGLGESCVVWFPRVVMEGDSRYND